MFAKIKSLFKSKRKFPIVFKSSVFILKNKEEALDKILDRIYATIGEYENLNEIEDLKIRTVLYITDMHFQIMNGGVLQFVDNGTGNDFYRIMDGLRELKLLPQVEMCNKIQKLFPNQTVPENWEKRRDLIDIINDEESVSKFDPEIFWNEMDDIYNENIQMVYKHIVDYIQEYSTNVA
jgi:hypothetical protein